MLSCGTQAAASPRFGALSSAFAGAHREDGKVDLVSLPVREQATLTFAVDELSVLLESTEMRKVVIVPDFEGE